MLLYLFLFFWKLQLNTYIPSLSLSLWTKNLLRFCDLSGRDSACIQLCSLLSYWRIWTKKKTHCKFRWGRPGSGQTLDLWPSIPDINFVIICIFLYIGFKCAWVCNVFFSPKSVSIRGLTFTWESSRGKQPLGECLIMA